MTTECYPIPALLPATRLFRDYLAMAESEGAAVVRAWYGAPPLAGAWMGGIPGLPALSAAHREALADALRSQSKGFGAGDAAFANIEKVRAGARAIVTGQQVGLLGGPLLTLLKASTAIARAQQATRASGVEHVPVFWLATEDHDLREVDQATFVAKSSVETLSVHAAHAEHTMPVGDVPLGPGVEAVLERAAELMGWAPVTELLRECYGQPGATFASSFGTLMTKLFAAHGLIVMDAARREFHRLGADVLKGAIEQAGELEEALLARTVELEGAGYHSQVLVKHGASLLFLISEVDGRPVRQPLRRGSDGMWKAGAGSGAKVYSTAELLAIAESAPERLSPNALLRPVFQDALLPTTAYVGGPAEVAYFAQSAVVYERLLGRVTPILPRLSATLIEPAIEKVMQQHEVALPEALSSAEALAQRLGARAMPIEAKRRLADAGNALDDAVRAAEAYLGTLDEGLGRSAAVSGSKMRYQMNRVRRLAANFELQREASLRKHAEAITLHLYPEGHAQERLVAGVQLAAAWEMAGLGDATGFIDRLVREAANLCPGHIVVRLAESAQGE